MNTNFEYPDDYLSFMDSLKNNEIYSDIGYIELFRLDKLHEINKNYEVEIHTPNFRIIGTNGGGSGIFFNTNNQHLYSMPFVGMDENDAILLANSFSEFIYKFRNEDLEII